MNGELSKYLTIPQAAELLGRPVETLRYWRKQGRGPLSALVGTRVVYRRADVEAWVEQAFTEAQAEHQSRKSGTA